MPERPDAGLCGACAHQRVVRTGRGSLFSLCLRSQSDARFAKYPRLPVVSCPGFERRPPHAPFDPDALEADLDV